MRQPQQIPPWRYGATIPLKYAKWVATHDVICMMRRTNGEPGVTLIASNKTSLTIHCSWGLVICDKDSLIRLEPNIHQNVIEIIKAEKQQAGLEATKSEE